MKKLTQREKEVLKLLIKGYSNPTIARVLSVSIHTIKVHLEKIYSKLGVNNRVCAAIVAYKSLILTGEMKEI